MKILITTDWYVPTVNGVVTSVLNLQKELLLRGHEVRVLTLSRTQHSYTRDNVAYLGSIGAGKIYPGARMKTVLSGNQIREILAWKPDIIHSQCELSTFLPAKKIAKKLNIPLIHTYHTVYEDYTHYFSPNQIWGREMAAALSRLVLRRTNCVIAPTEKVKSLLTQYHIDQEIRVIPTGITLEEFAVETPPERLLALKRSLNIPENNRVLLYVGRLAKEKNLEEVLRYYGDLRSEGVTFLLVGDGPNRASLEQLTARLELERRVVFAGMIAPEKVADYYHLGNLFVSASGSEAQGLTYLEALASGVPILCRRDDCLKGVVIDGQNGWQYQDEEDFMKKLSTFLQDGSLGERMSRNARQLAQENFSAATFAERAEAVYRDVLVHSASI